MHLEEIIKLSLDYKGTFSPKPDLEDILRLSLRRYKKSYAQYKAPSIKKARCISPVNINNNMNLLSEIQRACEKRFESLYDVEIDVLCTLISRDVCKQNKQYRKIFL